MVPPSDDGPTTGTRGQEIEASRAADKAREDEARSGAMREEALPIRGAGATRPEPQDRSVQGQTSTSAVDVGALAAFANNLLASSSELGEMDGAFNAEEEMEGPELEGEEPLLAGPVRSRPARKPRHSDMGGVADDEPESGPPERDGAPLQEAGSRRWPRVSARRRVRLLDLPSLLALGEEAGVLFGRQLAAVEPRVLALNSRGFGMLLEAVQPLTPLARTVVLQALVAHRRPEELAALAEVLGVLGGDEAVCTWLSARAARRPPTERSSAGIRPERAELPPHYDPCHHWLAEPAPPDTAAEEWPVPQWLRGAPRESMELCALAFLQASSGVLDPEHPPEEGSSDALTAALELHGEAHPAIARWCVTLAARADSGPGLLSAADALLSARSQL